MQLLYVLLSQKLNTAHEQGQSTVEYILVTLAAAMLAGVLIKLIGGFGKIVDVFNKVIDSILGIF
jgi:hypothetical protein